MEHWGTKINAFNSIIKLDEESADITFETASTPSLPVTASMAKLFPELTFRHSYEEPMQNFKGYQVYVRGELVENFEGAFYEEDAKKVGK